MKTSMELSLYPLGTNEVGTAVKNFIQVLTDRGCEITTGPMSTMVYGDSSFLFDAVSEAYEKGCEHGGIVLVIKASNACVP